MGKAAASRQDIALARTWLKRTGITDIRSGIKVVTALIKMGSGPTVTISCGGAELSLDKDKVDVMRRVQRGLKALVTQHARKKD